MVNVLLTKFLYFAVAKSVFFFMIWWFLTKIATKIGCFRLKSSRLQKVLQSTFGEIRRIQIQIYHQTSIEPKYGAFYFTDEVSEHGLVLLVQLS